VAPPSGRQVARLAVDALAGVDLELDRPRAEAGPTYSLMQSTGHTSMHDVSRQSRHKRVITQVIDASSLRPDTLTVDRQSSTVATYRLLVGRL
jgi:hypothetical protein